MTTFADFVTDLMGYEDFVDLGGGTLLTCEHSLSSYGEPVLIIGDKAYGKSDALDGAHGIDYATAREFAISNQTPLKSMDPLGYYERFCR